MRFVVGYWLGRVVTVVVLLIVGLLIAGAHRVPAPVPAERAALAQHRQEVLAQEYEEEARQASYAATPGPPYPTATFRP